jgi:multisubunit Na+/H+ antiporter MnhB subunit
MDLSSWIGSTGVTLLLLVFLLNLFNKLRSDSAAYLLLNVAGAGLACVSSLLISFWPFVVLEGVWALASLFLLIKKLKREK